MGFFDRLFAPRQKPAPLAMARLGRFSDSYKTGANYAAWDRSLKLFEQGSILDSYQAFFSYLRDEEQDNVHFALANGRLDFEIFQGSRVIRGSADHEKLRAEAQIARCEALNVVFMRRLAEKNFSLRYSRFALDPRQHISIVFDTFTLDGSPYKLYFALKEAATNADKLDDLLLDEFKVLRRADDEHLHHLPETQKEARYQFVQEKIRQALQLLNEGPLHREQYPSGYAYVLLSLIYQLDYLIQPEGHTMEALERMHRLYFGNDGKTTIEKNQALARGFDKLAARPKADFFKEMYRASFTFGITSPVQHDQIIRFIESELGNMDWYLDNGHPEIAMAVPGYIVGFSLFNYAPPKPVRDLLQLYYAICEPDYFKAIGWENAFSQNQRLDRKLILRAVTQIEKENKDKYPLLQIPIELLIFDSLPAFVRSYLWMIRMIEPTSIQGPLFHLDSHSSP